MRWLNVYVVCFVVVLLVVGLSLSFVSGLEKGYGFDGVPNPSITPTSTATITASPVPSDVIATSTPETSPSASPGVDSVPEFSSIGFLIVLIGLVSVVLVLAVKRSSKHEP